MQSRCGGGRRAPWAVVVVIWVLWAAVATAWAQAEGAGESPIRERVTARPLTAAGQDLFCREALTRFYGNRAFAPTWSVAGKPAEDARDLVAAIRGAFREGLDPGEYHLAAIASLMLRSGPAPLDPSAAADLDLLLTDAFLLLGAHLHAGRVNPESIDAEWFVTPRSGDMAALLEEALAAHRVRAALLGLLPSHPGYEKLRQALAHYRSIEAAGGWATVPEGDSLKPGDAAERVGLLWERLSADSPWRRLPAEPPAFYDAAVEAAVRDFQRRHGLEPDGVAGRATIGAMNVPTSDRVRQIEANLERWRWLPEDLGERYVLVNVADYSLEVVERGRLVLDMKVIVGKPYRHTPVFSDVMRTIVINPTWYVPRRIAVADKLPLIRKDPGYLRKMGMRVVAGEGDRARAVDPRSVDWSAVGPKHFPYRLVQAPGPQNALGRIKFLFPNRFNVYLHDTPSRELFERTERNFSSGCIRIEKPVELAEYLLADQPGWDPSRIQAVMDSGRETTIRLDRTIPVHLLYWTAFVDGVGDLQFRPDVYGRDTKLARALSERHHAAVPSGREVVARGLSGEERRP